MEEEGIVIPTRVPAPPSRSHSTTIPPNAAFFGANFNPSNPFSTSNHPLAPITPSYPYGGHPGAQTSDGLRKRNVDNAPFYDKSAATDFMNTFPEELMHVRLSKLSADGLYGILRQIDDLRPTVDKLGDALLQNAINGRVLMHCDLAELKSVCRIEPIDDYQMANNKCSWQILDLNFGNWEIFRQLVTGLREIERNQPTVKFGFDPNAFTDAMDSYVPPSASVPRQKSVMEKQVSGPCTIITMIKPMTNNSTTNKWNSGPK